MAIDFKLPDIGEGVHEGEIVSWLVKEGDVVKEDQPLVEVMTDKATVEIPSPAAGTILRLGGKEGEIVKVGSVLVVIGNKGESAVPSADGKATAQKAPQAAQAASGKTLAPPPASSPATAVAPAPQGRVLATPATRKLARELSVDISQVRGSGPAGRVMDADVKSFSQGGAVAAPGAPTRAPSVAPSTTAASPSTKSAPPAVRPRVVMGTEERIPLRGIRKRISDHMHYAKSTAAHFTYVDEVDMTQLVKVRVDLKAIAEKQNVKLTFLPFIVKACVGALKKHAYLNGSIDYEKEEIVLKNYYNIGIATATDQGLIVPVIKGADQLSMVDIAAEIERLSNAAREGKIALEDIQGGTFTITSLGALGGLFATPIINTPESAILGIHEIKKRPVVIDNEIVIREIMNIALSFDHRLIDGHVGAAFAKDVKAFLEEPKWLLVGA
ncbi:2-oxo acid dehydrogenase subunit E2 [Candidatus Acetothermia bacterium]|nr:2-oxo acid dehydrogenase subunit E2 [Candidatus Acetothermia bacterium]MBI3643338.1 2-oxo acid dehydrogenase subunit E2 [Candidatus Acetothermia bacterium]